MFFRITEARNTEELQIAFDMGYRAAQNGKKLIPGRDKELMDFIGSYSFEDRAAHRRSINLVKAYGRGFSQFSTDDFESQGGFKEDS